jgi:RAD51-like protein 2
MAARPAVRTVASLGLPQALQDQLSMANYVYVDDLRGVRPLELARDLKVTNEQALRVLQAASAPAAKSLAGATTALEITQHPRRRISTGSRAIDGILGGGVALGEVIEFCGPPGMGKTQLGMQLAVNCQRPEPCGGLAGHAVYIDTEGSFTAERAEDMSRAMLASLSDSSSQGGAGSAPAASIAATQPQPSQGDSLSAAQKEKIAQNRAAAMRKRKASTEKTQQLTQAAVDALDVDSMLSKIFVYRVYDCTEQLAVNHILPSFLEAHPDVRVVVIDSVAFHFRHDYEELAQRTRLLAAYSQALTAMAKRFGVAVVLMNQVTTKFESASAGGGGDRQAVEAGGARSSSGGTLVPALGNSWAHACTARCMLYWERGTRYARLIKSSNLPDQVVPYRITADGVTDLQAEADGAVAQ